MKVQGILLLGTLSFAKLPQGSPLGAQRSKAAPLVDLEYARYEGTALNTGVNQFLGIRYAAPPLDDLRFRAPQEPLHQHGIQKAQQVNLIWTCWRVFKQFCTVHI